MTHRCYRRPQKLQRLAMYETLPSQAGQPAAPLLSRRCDGYTPYPLGGAGVGKGPRSGCTTGATTAFSSLLVATQNGVFFFWFSGAVARARAIIIEAGPSILSRLESRSGFMKPVPFCVFHRKLLTCQRSTGSESCENSFRSIFRIPP